MKFHTCILIFSIVSLFFIILAQGTDNSASSKEEKAYNEVKKAFGPAFDDVKDKLGPISSLDLEQFEEAKDAFGPIPSFDEAKEALGPAASPILDKAKEALGPISPAAIDDAKKVLGPATSKAKEALGPSSSDVIDKARDKFDSIASWFTQNKENVSPEDQTTLTPSDAPSPVSPLDPYGLLDGAKQKFDSLLDSITQEKQQISSSLLQTVSSTDVDKAKEALSPGLLSSSEEAQKKMGPTSDFDMDISSSPSSSSAPGSSEGLDLSKIIDEAKEKSGSITSLITKNKEEMSSDSPSFPAKSRKELRPVSSPDDASSTSTVTAPAPGPALASTFREAIDAAKEKFSSITTYLSQNKLQVPPESDIKLHSTSAFFDQDSALAIESMIKQAQTNSQLAIDEAKTLLSDPIDSQDTGKCVTKCMTNYETCSQKLNKALEDLKARNVELLKGDIGAVEGELNACQKCFQENTKTQSPFSDLEEATIKATRECLNVLDHSG